MYHKSSIKMCRKFYHDLIMCCMIMHFSGKCMKIVVLLPERPSQRRTRPRSGSARPYYSAVALDSGGTAAFRRQRCRVRIFYSLFCFKLYKKLGKFHEFCFTANACHFFMLFASYKNWRIWEPNTLKIDFTAKYRLDFNENL